VVVAGATVEVQKFDLRTASERLVLVVLVVLLERVSRQLTGSQEGGSREGVTRQSMAVHFAGVGPHWLIL
jgi:hypothetical protein